jgi:site-specific DNA recombinase
MKAVGYCRVSSQEQINGTSLETQRNQIEAYATMKGIDLVDLFSDEGVSGSKPMADRPEGSKLTALVDCGDVQAVIIVKLDRGFRSVVDCLQSVDAWERRHIALHIVDLGGNSIDTTSPAGRFMLTVLSAAGEMERGMINDRCNSGRKARKAQGMRIGEIPFGFDLDSVTHKLVINEEEQKAITLAQDLKAQGYSNRAIARELDRREVPTKKRGTWTHVQVASLLRSA